MDHPANSPRGEASKFSATQSVANSPQPYGCKFPVALATALLYKLYIIADLNSACFYFISEFIKLIITYIA